MVVAFGGRGEGLFERVNMNERGVCHTETFNQQSKRYHLATLHKIGWLHVCRSGQVSVCSGLKLPRAVNCDTVMNSKDSISFIGCRLRLVQ